MERLEGLDFQEVPVKGDSLVLQENKVELDALDL